MSAVALPLPLRLATGLTLLLLSGAAAACDDGFTPGKITRISLAPANPRVPEGGTIQLSAAALDGEGGRLPCNPVTWSSWDPTRAQVDWNGFVRTLAPGTAVISAACGGVEGQTTLTITAIVVGSVTVSPRTATLDGFYTVQLSAEVRDTAGKLAPTKPLTWSSGNLFVVTVTSTGLVTGVSYGRTTVVATSGGKADTATITVIPPANSLLLRPESPVLGLNRSGRLVLFLFNSRSERIVVQLPLIWRSSSPQVATVDSSSGLITGRALGSTTITSDFFGQITSALLTVVATPVATVTPDTDRISLCCGQSHQVVPTLRDAAGNLLLGRLVSYSSSNRNLVTVDPDGIIWPGPFAGEATVTVTSEGASATIAVTSH